MLIERAADMLARREPVSLRRLVAGTGVSSMAVYTYFDGMPGLWGAVRQEGFTRLASALAGMSDHPDPVTHLAAVSQTYLQSATATPDLYRAMFDGTVALPDPQAAEETFAVLRTGVQRAVDEGRFRSDLDVQGLTNQIWVAGHGVCMLVCSDVLGPEVFESTLKPLLVNLCIAAGDAAPRAEASIAAGWAR